MVRRSSNQSSDYNGMDQMGFRLTDLWPDIDRCDCGSGHRRRGRHKIIWSDMNSDTFCPQRSKHHKKYVCYMWGTE
jgi:hypothetical protein